MEESFERRVKKVKGIFESRFGKRDPIVVAAPGRVNLIGEHTDYNDGYVFPVAIDKNILICGRENTDNKIKFYSADFDENAEYEIDNFEFDNKHRWANYLLGVIDELQKLGFVSKGVDAVVEGNIPIASGLSSSAALEVATATFIETIEDLRIEPTELAKLCQRAENRFVGVQCGIMDQFVSKLGKEGYALFIDCRTLDYEHIPIGDSSLRILIGDTGVKRGLVDSEYNRRRKECEEGARLLDEILDKPVSALRDVTLDEFNRVQGRLPEVVAKRCRHVISENERVLRSMECLQEKDYPGFGKLLNESHDSLRDDYQVTCRELDIMVGLLQKNERVLGARMTGAGFGGCTVSLINARNEAEIEEIVTEISSQYKRATGIEGKIFSSQPKAGARRIF